VRSENDRTALHERMQALNMEDEEEYDDGAEMLSPTSPGTASVTSGLDAVSEGDGELETAESREKIDGLTNSLDETGERTPIGKEDREIVMHAQSAPTTPMA
jgi:hypothetical protein